MSAKRKRHPTPPSPASAAPSSQPTPAKPPRSRGRGRLVEFLVVWLLIGIALGFRLADLAAWTAQPEQAFHAGEPIPTGYDAGYYLGLAQDLLNGTYQTMDTDRVVPEGRPRPTPPPLLSALAAGLVALTPFSLDWVGAILPAVLGSLLVVPMYLLGRLYGGPLMGITAALFASLYPAYLARSGLGWFDTDVLNVTWTVTAAYLFLRFGRASGAARYGYLAGGLLVYGLFLWWWDQAPEAVTAITLLPLAVALVFFDRPGRREGIIFYGGLGAAGLGAAAYLGPTGVLDVGRGLWQKFDYIVHSPSADGPFPSIGVSISEQNNLELQTLLNATTQEPFPLVLAALGLAALFIRRPRDGLFLASLVVLAAGSYFANRFLIFFVPLLALGTGYALVLLQASIRRYPLAARALPVVVLAGMAWPLVQASQDLTLWPRQSASQVAALKSLQTRTEPRAVIWSWWDNGYAIQYFAERGTMADGAEHGGERAVYTARPLAMTDPREAAHFMHFYVTQGRRGITELVEALDGDHDAALQLLREVFQRGPEAAARPLAGAELKPVAPRRHVDDWLAFLFPTPTRPVYLFIDHGLIDKSYWWHWFGTWDIAEREGQHGVYQGYTSIQRSDGYLVSADGLRLNLRTGRIEVGTQAIPLAELWIRVRGGFQREPYRKTGLRFEMMQGGTFGALMDETLAESLFNRLFLRHMGSEAGLFEPVELATPSHQLWRVHQEAWRGAPSD